MEILLPLWHHASKRNVTGGEAGCVAILTQPGNPASQRSGADKINLFFDDEEIKRQ